MKRFRLDCATFILRVSVITPSGRDLLYGRVTNGVNVTYYYIKSPVVCCFSP